MKRVISLVFKSGTTLADRQLAIAYVGGTIVGGVQGDDGEGGYLVSIASDGSVSALTAAINRLSSLPQVDFAVETARGAPNSLESVHGAKRTSRPHSPAFVSDSDPNRDSSRASSTARLAASPPVLLSLTCMLARASTVISCQPARPRSAAGVRASVIQGDTAAYASFLSHGFVKDTVARTWTFAANVRNLLEQSIGTLNGTTVTGVKVIVTDVRATAGKGTVSVANADGIGNFTVPNQPHFNYNQVVAPSGYSVNKLWKLNVPNTVTSVCMSILISTHFPAEQNVTALPPATRPAWFNDDSSWTGPQHDDFLKRVITLWFREGTTLQDRQLAIAYVNGTVVGGEPLSSGDGVYYVKVGDDGSGTQLGVAISRLKRLPQVEVAALTSAGSPGS
jgi:hypothetical protein